MESHEIGINVKDRESFRLDYGDLPESRVECMYESLRERFWADAELLAQEAGYGQVFAEGRSGGWLVVEREPDVDDAAAMRKFKKFAESILQLKRDAHADFEAEIAEAKRELEAEIEADKSLN